MKKRFLERGGIWVVGQGLLMLGVAGLGLIHHTDRRHLALFVLGIAFLVFGAFFGITGALALRHNLTPYPKPLPHAQLVRHGIYARIRHPLYTSVLFATIGWALLWQSWTSLLVAFVLIPFFTAKARREERWLQDRFPDYTHYAKGTWRFFPWIY